MAFLTVKELAARWHRPRGTVRWWLLFARRRYPPSPEQRRLGPHGECFYRVDYVAMLEAAIAKPGGRAAC